MQQYIISDNKNNIIFVIDNLKLAFNIVRELLIAQIKLTNKLYITNYNQIPEYYISYNKEFLINKYLFKIIDNDLIIYFNNEISIDDNTIITINEIKKNFDYFNKEDYIKMKNDLDKYNEIYNTLKNKYTEDKKIFFKIHDEINNNKIQYTNIPEMFIKKYDFFLLNIDKLCDEQLISQYEKIK